MRIWDLPPAWLCDRHLLGEHAELHAVWAVITKEKAGYAKHPETERWRGRLLALYGRHDRLVSEMESRGFRHRSPLDQRLATGERHQPLLLDPPGRQAAILMSKPCECLRSEGVEDEFRFSSSGAGTTGT